ncbi:MAG TPA: topoisomerase II [Candidatus Stackebrandtia excrementipullorum]|nr:topoisomerase II [Candidatus Stackebrandtia excrementipullorum]
MSKRRKHGAKSATTRKQKIRDVFVARPFEGLAGEGDWIAMRELLPAATAPLKLKPEYTDQVGDRKLIVTTVLPLAWPAMSRADNTVFVAMQRQFQSGDVSRDIAASLLAALAAEPGHPVAVPARPGVGPRLQDLLANDELDVTLHENFDYWLSDDTDAGDPQIAASMERANASVYPTTALATADGAYWCSTPDQTHVRIVLPEDEDSALDGLARLRAADELKLTEESKFAGMFRAHGLLVPVWDLPREATAEDCEAPVSEFMKRYATALTESEPLNSTQRRSRDGLVGRQLTLR